MTFPEPLSAALRLKSKSLLYCHYAPIYQLASSYSMQIQRYE